MSRVLEPGTYRIVSRMEGKPPIGVHLFLPVFQPVQVNAPQQKWEVERMGERRYKLRCDPYRFTGVVEDKVTASMIPEHDGIWVITYHERQHGYTIVTERDPMRGWTVPENLEEGNMVEIKPIVETKSLPPRFFERQLFGFERYE